MLQSLIFFHGPEIPIVKKTQQPLHCFSSSLCFFREPAISDPTYLFKWVIPGSLANIHTSDWVACIYDAEHIQQPQQNILFICCIKNITAVFSSTCLLVVYSSLDNFANPLRKTSQLINYHQTKSYQIATLCTAALCHRHQTLPAIQSTPLYQCTMQLEPLNLFNKSDIL